MEFKVFSELIDALGKVTTGLKSIINFSSDEREKYRKTMEETYRLIDTALTMIIIRLGDISLKETDDELLEELAKLNNTQEWLNAERAFRVCSSLRATEKEMETIITELTGKLSVADWEKLLQQMKIILTAEYDLAKYISQKFEDIAKSARNAKNNSLDASQVKLEATAFRNSLISERQQLIRQEINIYSII